MKQRSLSLFLILAAALCLAACAPAAEVPPLEETLTGYTAEQAAADGCVVLDGSQLLAGEALWYDFVNESAAGREIEVSLYQGYSDQGGQYFVKQLRFDGERYVLRFYDRDSKSGEPFLVEESYAFLTRALYAPDAAGELLTEGWLLTDDAGADHQGYFGTMLSSVPSTDDRYAHCHPILGRRVDADFLPGAFYGIAYADADGDGKQEQCRLGLGRTSGLFTFTLTVRQGEETLSENTYLSPWYDLSFAQKADGALRVRAATQDEPPAEHIFTLRWETGRVILVREDGEELRPMN